nr:MAG TPA: hypothetical protein [Caudoviricetes sp.]
MFAWGILFVVQGAPRGRLVLFSCFREREA